MNDNINLIAFGTFGNPNGYTQTFFIGNLKLSKSIRTFDINTSALNLFPGSKVYAIRKDFLNGEKMIAYSIYTYAREQNSTRGGTFIGSSILYVDKIAEESVTLDCLNEFHHYLENKNVETNIIKVNHSNNFSVKTPREFDKIKFHLREIEGQDFAQINNKHLVVYCETKPEKLKEFFKNSIDLLNVYDTIYFTESTEVAEFVHQKNIFTLLKREAFEQEVIAFREELKRRVLAAISGFEKEIEHLDHDKAAILKELNNQIEQNTTLHKENETKINESKTNLEKVELLYNAFNSSIKGLADGLRSGKRLEEVKSVYTEKRNRFIEDLHQFKKPVSLNQISNVSARSGLQGDYQHQQYEGNYQRNSSSTVKEKYRINGFKVATAVLLIFLIGSWIYFILSNKQIQSKPIQNKKQNAFITNKITKTG